MRSSWANWRHTVPEPPYVMEAIRYTYDNPILFPRPPELWRWWDYAECVYTAYLHATDAMPQPKWLENVQKEIAGQQPSTLQEGRTEFDASTMTEPKMSGKFRKYAFTCKTLKGQTINLSVSASLLQRIIEKSAGLTRNFAITKQGEGLNTQYVVESI